ncbi:MAG TPA: carboxypeptidase-like regulatory domain-containing protein [Chthoniobacterales bacterium]|nr:carboxypeptidase-like regulatory domain-containing protein [Chthoniobacterales bacterium]
MTEFRTAFAADPPRRISDAGFLWLLRIIPLVLFFTTTGWPQAANAEEETIQGQILNRAGQPLPGCTVFVASAEYRTPPAITDSSGDFQIIAPFWKWRLGQPELQAAPLQRISISEPGQTLLQ